MGTMKRAWKRSGDCGKKAAAAKETAKGMRIHVAVLANGMQMHVERTIFQSSVRPSSASSMQVC